MINLVGIIIIISTIVLSITNDITKKVATERIEKWLNNLPDSLAYWRFNPISSRILPIINMFLFASLIYSISIEVLKYLYEPTNIITITFIGIGVGVICASIYYNNVMLMRAHKEVRYSFMLGFFSFYTLLNKSRQDELKDILRAEKERFLTSEEIHKKEAALELENFYLTMREATVNIKELKPYMDMIDKYVKAK